MKAETMLRIEAHAKINLGLDVTGKREDGYHLVRMIMQALELHDTLYFEKTECPGVELRTGMQALATDKSNLIVRAAELLLSTCKQEKGVRIKLKKRIPLAAGLAGGSADAAATLLGINKLYQLGMNEEKLCRLGVQLGADIPYCIRGGTALSEGIGEVLTPLPDLPFCYIVLGKPKEGMSTAEAYRELDNMNEIQHPDIEGQIRALSEGSLAGVAERLGNVLEPVTASRQPEVGKIRKILLEAGAAGARMSGSGPTVFGIFTEEEKAQRACSVLKKEPLREVILTTPAQNGRSA